MALGLFRMSLSERREILPPPQDTQRITSRVWKHDFKGSQDPKKAKQQASAQNKRLPKPAMFWSEFEKDAFRRNRNEQEKLLVKVDHMDIAQKIQGRFFDHDMVPYRIRGEQLEKLILEYSEKKRQSLRAQPTIEQLNSIVIPATNDVYVVYIDDKNTDDFNDVTTYKTDGGLEYTLAYERPASSCANFAILQGAEVEEKKEAKIASFLKASKAPPVQESLSMGHIDTFVHVITKEALLNMPEFETNKQTKHVKLPGREIQSAQVGHRTAPTRPKSRDESGMLLRSKSAQPRMRNRSAQLSVQIENQNQGVQDDTHVSLSTTTSPYGTRPPTRSSSVMKTPGLHSSKPSSALPPRSADNKHQLLRGSRYQAFLQLKRKLRKKEEKRSLNLLRKLDKETQISIEKLKYRTCQINVEEFNKRIDKQRKDAEIAEQLNLLSY